MSGLISDILTALLWPRPGTCLPVVWLERFLYRKNSNSRRVECMLATIRSRFTIFFFSLKTSLPAGCRLCMARSKKLDRNSWSRLDRTKGVFKIGFPLPLGTVRGLYDQPFLVAKRLYVVGFLLAKQPGKAMLIQETGLQRELNLDEVARRTPENEAALLERKIASSFIQGGGAIEWLWNTNSYMTESNETPIGAVRTDGTEKPEATLLRDLPDSRSLCSHIASPSAASRGDSHVTGGAVSVIAQFQLEAQQKAIRAWRITIA